MRQRSDDGAIASVGALCMVTEENCGAGRMGKERLRGGGRPDGRWHACHRAWFPIGSREEQHRGDWGQPGRVARGE